MFDFLKDRLVDNIFEIFKSIPTEDIIFFIDNYDLSELITQYINKYLQDENIRDLVIGYLRYYWKDIQEILTYEKVFAILVTQKPDILKYLNKSRKEKLKNQINKIRELLYKIAWEW